MNSHHDPSHPRFCTPGRWKAILFAGRYSHAARMIHNDPGAIKKDAHMVVETRGKNGGPRYLMFFRNGKLLKGVQAVRCDREGNPIPRARKMIPGVSGKSFMRRFKRELREEKQQVA